MLASSSRHALTTTQRRVSSVVAETCSSANFSRCTQQQQRDASTAATKQNIFKPPRGEQYRQGGLRHGPYAYQPDTRFRGSNGSTALARFNLEIGKRVERNMTRNALLMCKQMKDEGVQPDLTTYGYIIEMCAKGGHHFEARAAFEDMLAMGLEPNRRIFHHLLDAFRFLDTTSTWEILDLMKQFNITPNEITYEIIIFRYTESGNLELALQYLAEMGTRGLSPTLKTAGSIINTANRRGFPRLALDLADAFEQSSVRRLEGSVWMECLIASSDALFEDGVLRVWQKVIHELNMLPDEGCCLQVLHTVGRHGLSALGLDALRVLGRIGVAWQEFHFAPVIEGLCKEDKTKEALAMLDMIRSHGITPVAETAYPIFKSLKGDPDAIDEAWGHLETLREEGKTIDVTALNVIIQASAALGDLQRAVGTYKACYDLGVSPNVDTYNLLLAGCITAQHRELGDRLLSEMKEAAIKPDVRTYERLIVLCLTQTNYEDAFFYLEEMKTEGHIPPLAVYEAIIRKCMQLGDTRYRLALEEMVECGYKVSPKLNSFIQSGGEHDGSEEWQSTLGDDLKERKRKQFLEGIDDATQGVVDVKEAGKI